MKPSKTISSKSGDDGSTNYKTEDLIVLVPVECLSLKSKKSSDKPAVDSEAKAKAAGKKPSERKPERKRASKGSDKNRKPTGVNMELKRKQSVSSRMACMQVICNYCTRIP